MDYGSESVVRNMTGCGNRTEEKIKQGAPAKLKRQKTVLVRQEVGNRTKSRKKE